MSTVLGVKAHGHISTAFRYQRRCCPNTQITRVGFMSDALPTFAAASRRDVNTCNNNTAPLPEPCDKVD